MRLIDADALHLGKFVEPRTEWHQGWNDALDAATTQAPTIDAVPVVRCEDCEYFLEEGGVLEPWCDWHEARMIGRGGFCSEGKRKDGDGNV